MHNKYYSTVKGRKSCQMLQDRCSWNIQYQVEQTRQKVQILCVSMAWGTWNSLLPRNSKEEGGCQKQRRPKRTIKLAFSGYDVPSPLDEGILNSEQTTNKINFKNQASGDCWRDVSTVECLLLLRRTQVQFPSPTRSLQLFHGIPHPLLASWALHAHKIQTYMKRKHLYM